MKNLKYYKKQTKHKQAQNRFQLWADDQIDQISARVRVSAARRWKARIDELDLQRCKLNDSIDTYYIKYPKYNKLRELAAYCNLYLKQYSIPYPPK